MKRIRPGQEFSLALKKGEVKTTHSGFAPENPEMGTEEKGYDIFIL